MSYHWGDFIPADSDPGAALDELAAAFALRDQAEAEEMIESFCAEAVRAWRLQDATFWQRVKFRARLLRKRVPDTKGNSMTGSE